MRLLVALASSAFLLTSQAASAQSDTARRAAGPKPDLSLVSDRSIAINTDEGTWISLDVSPDAQTIVFDLLGDLYTIPIAGGTATQLTSGMGYDVQPRFSPDGQSIVFVSDRDGGENVWVMDLSTKKFRAITKGKTTGRYRSPEWTPDGQYIVVSRSGPAIGVSKLWMYNKDGGSGYQLIRDPQPLAGAVPLTTLGAAFGKDPRYIWYAQRNGAWEYNSALPQFSIFTLDRRTGRREGRANVHGSAFRPALSSDGRYLVYATRYEDKTGLRLRDLETMEEKWLAYPVQRDEQESVAALDAYPGYSFTPDNRAIVVSYGGKIWRVPVDGSAATNIPFRVQTNLALGPLVKFTYAVSDSAEFIVRAIRDAVPSPDGRRLAFVSMDRLYVMDYPGGTPRRVSDVDGNEADPAWSPDGNWIAYVVWSRSGGALHKVRVAGAGAQGARPQQLTTGNAFYAEPVFSPDGSRIALSRRPYQSVRDAGGFVGGTEIVWVPANGGAATLIAASQGRGAPHFVSSDTGRVYLFSGGEGIVSIRWDGTDPLTHVRITGHRTPEAEQPTNAGWAQMAPAGDRALVQVANDLFVIQVPQIGSTPTINLANPENAEVPARRVTDVGGSFPAWSADGRRVHWSIGNSHFVYDLERARQMEDSIAAAAAGRDSAAAQTDTTRRGAGPAATPRGYQPVETKITLRARRDIPDGAAVLRGARIITMRGAGATGTGVAVTSEIIDRGDIVVRNNRIVAVGAQGSVQVPQGARVVDVAGKTILPGFVDTHAHPGILGGQHQQPASYLANLAYGVTAIRDPQTGSTDVLSYEDEVTAGVYVGPRIYSTGPGLFGPTYFAGLADDIKDLDHARRIMRRYSEYYDTKTLKMYITGNRQQRQWIVQAAREQRIMPTTEGALDQKYDMTLTIDGYSGLEHSLPITPLYKDVVKLMAESGITYTPTLVVAYGGPWAENYWYEHMPVYNDPKVQRFTPYEELAAKSRRRMRGQTGSGNAGGWFMDEEYNFPLVARAANDIIKAGGRVGIGSHGQLNGLGYHWEMWSLAMGGTSAMNVLRAATIIGAEGIGLEKDLGSIEVGKLADLVVLDANPLESIRNTNTVRYVMKNGRLYDGNTLDEIHPRVKKMEPLQGRPERPNVRAGMPQ